ncbi:succinate dehydrogenase, cytochrome b556 subunit [Candidatus Raskinella chloraquaticus]|uniref:Succinate dehydrogenase cytochrome b556 subunit n=1 Tax=Candidatus Raskinella chloraquaticus TaxID=1951219 RepID=A0A1W9HZQ8_9HYPH|nr:succinate dehydrogenase, cytochrome b556 subunit [Hyphomicrobiales bacterium]OQW52701.1 MAG: succinate dehydrogenase, cytochrome b556 subunit [Proteobacteria bacterium SG_bin8]OQW85360.1 MAG: succinate dehydrogenase, cytochrome b556 subunit [Proteobacteria bacterium ST_bin15]
MSRSVLPASRPLSPHLQIYRFSLLMASSIVHRITGAGLYFGTCLVVFWLLALASGPQAYATFAKLAGSPLGLLILFAYTWALMQHMMGGLRHLIWDTGASLSVAAARRLAAAGWLIALLLTLAVWAIVFIVR